MEDTKRIHKECIHRMIDTIENEAILRKLFIFVKVFADDYAEEKPPVQTAEHKQMLGKIRKVRNMDIYKYTLYTDDMNIIKDLSAGDLFTIISYSFDYGFYQGIQYMKDKQRKRAKKKPRPGSRAEKLQQLMELAGKIPDTRLDALLCWANQYQRGEGELNGV